MVFLIIMLFFNVLDDGSYDGNGYFEIKVTRNSGVVYNLLALLYINIDGDRDVVFDTIIATPSNFLVTDKDSNSFEYTDDFVVNALMQDDADHYEWIIGEEFSQKPATTDQRWATLRPREYMFKNSVIENKYIYLWAKDRAGNISGRASAKY